MQDDVKWGELRASLFRMLRARVGDDDTAEDLVQETFVRVQKHLGSLEDDQRLSAWVHRIARNLLIDYYRQPAKPETSTSGLVADRDIDGEHFHNELVGGWLQAMIEQLPQKYRTPLRWVELEGVTQVEVAERLGLSVSGAKSRIQRGRAQLRKILDDCCRVEFDRRGNVLTVEPRPTCC